MSSVTRLGDFLKFLGIKFLAKVAQIFLNNFGIFWKLCTFYIKLMWILFGELSEKIALLFTPTSGHTGDASMKLLKICLRKLTTWQIENSVPLGGRQVRTTLLKIFNWRQTTKVATQQASWTMQRASLILDGNNIQKLRQRRRQRPTRSFLSSAENIF